MPLKTAFSSLKLPERFHDRAFLDEYGRIESLRAARSSASFSVVMIQLEWSACGEAAPKTDGRSPGPEGEGALGMLPGPVSSAITDCVRDSDIIALWEDGTVICLLPDTDYFGSLVAIRKISRSLAALGKDHPEVAATLSNATCPRDGRGYDELISHASRCAEQKKRSPWKVRGMGRMLFWEIVSEFYRGDIKGVRTTCFDAGAGHSLPASVIDRLNEQVITEIARAPHKKGIVYMRPRSASSLRSITGGLAASRRTGTKVFIVTTGMEAEREIKNAFAVPIDDERLSETSFTFFLSEDTGYGLICKENWGGSYSCFHTSDAFLVEGLITKLQIEYSLQVQLG